MIVTRQQIIRAAEALGWPESGAFAASLYRMEYGYYRQLSHDESHRLMNDAGYVAFCGYPLSRRCQRNTMTMAEIKLELETNPLCLLTHEVNITLSEVERNQLVEECTARR